MTGTCLSLDQSYATFQQMADHLSGPGLIPVTITMPLPEVSPATLYQHLRTPRGFLLESMEGVPRRAVRSIIGTGILDLFTIDDEDTSRKDPLNRIRDFMKERVLHERSHTGFSGGLVGYCSYDLVSDLNEGYLDAGKEENTPKGKFMIVDSGVVLDHQVGTCTIFVTSPVVPGED